MGEHAGPGTAGDVIPAAARRVVYVVVVILNALLGGAWIAGYIPAAALAGGMFVLNTISAGLALGYVPKAAP